MDTASFLDALRGAFEEFPDDETPRNPFFESVLSEVEGLAKPNNLALIAAATSAMDGGESYVEAGSFKGASLIAAAYGKQGEFVGIDDFSMQEGSRELLAANLRVFGCSHATIIESDVFDALRSGSLNGRRVGVYYYDAAHGHEQQLAGLRLIEPYLSEESILIIDDTDWEEVERAVDDYLGSQPNATELLRLRGKAGGTPAWWEGMRVLSWKSQPAL
jgi:predicted O-methyltransferase YrrM